MKLVLFDIDGTLLLTGGATRRAMVAAGRQCFGDAFDWRPVTIGRLDPQLLDELVDANGCAPTAEERRRFRGCYVHAFEEQLALARGDVHLLPGIRELLDRLLARQARGEVLCGVLTGNLRAVAEAKLKAAGVEPQAFAILACGEGASDRPALLAVAMKDAAARAGHPISPAHTFVIGDTPRDVECAKAHRCVSVAVATGHFSQEALSAAGADLVLPDFADPAPFLAVLGDAA